MSTSAPLPNKLLLAGDIGATNTRLALFKQDDLRNPVRLSSFKGQNYPGLAAILQEFLSGQEQSVAAASIGAAGPIINERVKLTNLPWTVDAQEIRSTFQWEGVWLINDLQAIANSVPLLQADDLHPLKGGTRDEHGNVCVVAPGTGLGVGFLTWTGAEYRAHATEGGHIDFAPVTPLQDELLVYMRDKLSQVQAEHVCSGLGLPNIFNFLHEVKRHEVPDWLKARLDAANDKTPIIVEAALEDQPGNQICQNTLEIFIQILGATASSLALAFGSTGGVFIGGGIPPRILPELKRYNFSEFFLNKVGFENYLRRFPVNVIMNTDAGLLGAAAFGLQQLSGKTN